MHDTMVISYDTMSAAMLQAACLRVRPILVEFAVIWRVKSSICMQKFTHCTIIVYKLVGRFTCIQHTN